MTTRNPQPFHIAATVDGGFYWRLDAANGEPLAHSETYASKAGAVHGALAAIANVLIAAGCTSGEIVAAIDLITEDT